MLGSGLRNTRPGYSVILDELLVGEYPTLADIAWLAETASVRAVLSLQDEADLLSKALDAAKLAAEYARHGIEFRRVPIQDGDPGALAARLDTAVGTLHELLGRCGRVYLHCNAGYNRAPTVAIGYLHRHRGLSLDDACGFVKARRACLPYMSVFGGF